MAGVPSRQAPVLSFWPKRGRCNEERFSSRIDSCFLIELNSLLDFLGNMCSDPYQETMFMLCNARLTNTDGNKKKFVQFPSSYCAYLLYALTKTALNCDRSHFVDAHSFCLPWVNYTRVSRTIWRRRTAYKIFGALRLQPHICLRGIHNSNVSFCYYGGP